MKKCLICFICSLFSFCLCSCCSAKPVATASHERIETQMQPIDLPTDSVVVTLASPTPQPIKIVAFEASRPAQISHSYFDSLQQLKIKLRPDTIYVPYTTHIRSDTIVAPCPTTQAKLTTSRWKITALLLVLIAIIIYRLKPLFINP